MHLHWRSILLVFAGGALGTAIRYLLTLAVPPVAGVPFMTFLINVTGAFVLGLLLQSLALRGSDDGVRRDVRLFAGTGILGGFTTYSSLAVDADGLIAAQSVGLSILYAVATIAVGAAASIGGIALASAFARRQAGRFPR
ncbi:CrcB family protein [Leifsonia sp. fls2-241-R2A-40a]|uniref:fluoride efflux transporter FluC n=1 Tax=Leifsonia sp. fls2-241-R2A-40a TaxID=3040290 RepID=UPI00254EE6C4|nr:CrcB family protein [Leifsonia sp. fls2-241-R2A-40a]